MSELYLKKQQEINEPNFSKVGDVVTSMLDEAAFQAERNSTWVLMGGRSVSGSKYETLTGDSTIPDARGQFLRGLDTSGTVDPDGAGRTLGDTQADAMQGHKHQSFGTLGGSIPTGTLGPSQSGSNGSYNTHLPVNDGVNGIPRTASETRPKNITINYFIKIDD